MALTVLLQEELEVLNLEVLADFNEFLGNYAPCLGPSGVAKKKGYTITLFLDAKTAQVINYQFL